jgi:hypothetical protein
VETSGAHNSRDHKREREGGEFSGTCAGSDVGDARSIRVIIPHELERIDEGDEIQIEGRSSVSSSITKRLRLIGGNGELHSGDQGRLSQ